MATQITPEQAIASLSRIYGNGAMGAPEHVLLERSEDPNFSHEVTLLSIPRMVGVAYDEYDPETFDPVAAREKLPPYQRHFTNGIESMIRWRTVKDETTGEIKQKSNARVIQWENTDVHLQVGRQYFQIRIKGTRSSDPVAGQEKLVEHLFVQMGDVFYHIGNITSAWKTSVLTKDLAALGPRMAAVKARLVQEAKEAKQ
eukprot:UN02843